MTKINQLKKILLTKPSPRVRNFYLFGLISVVVLGSIFSVLNTTGQLSEFGRSINRFIAAATNNDQFLNIADKYAVFTNLNRVIPLRSTTIEVGKLGINQGMGVSSVDNEEHWKRLKTNGFGYVVGLVFSPDEVESAAKFIVNAYQNEMIPIIRPCVNVAGSCGFNEARFGKPEQLGAGVGKFCVDVFKASARLEATRKGNNPEEADGLSFYCIIGPNEPATEAKHWLAGFPSGGKIQGPAWQSLADMSLAALEAVKSQPTDKYLDFGKIQVAPGAFNLSNNDNDEVKEFLFGHILKNKKTLNTKGEPSCVQWDAFFANGYNLYVGNDTELLPGMSIMQSYLGGAASLTNDRNKKAVTTPQPNSLAKASADCGVPVIFSEVGFLPEKTNPLNELDYCGSENPHQFGGGLNRFQRLIEPLRIQLQILLNRKELIGAMLYRPFADPAKKFYPDQKYNPDTPATDCQVVMTDPEIMYIGSEFGLDSNKNNDYPACTYNYDYKPESIVKTANFTEVEKSSSDKVRLSLFCDSKNGQRCEAKGYTTMELWTPTKAIVNNAGVGTIRNQFLSVCGLLQSSLFSAVPFSEGDIKNFNTSAMVAVPAKVGSEQYPIPGLESARNCSELYKLLIDFEDARFKSVAELKDKTQPDISNGQDLLETFGPDGQMSKPEAFATTDLGSPFGKYPDYQTVSLYSHDGDSGVLGQVPANDAIVRNMTFRDVYTSFNNDTAFQVAPQGSNVKVGVLNPDLMLPGPEKRIKEFEQIWSGGGEICWDAIVHRETRGNGNVIKKAIFGEDMNDSTKCKWVGSFASNKACPFASLTGYFNGSATLKNRTNKASCYQLLGNIREYRLEAEFDQPKFTGNVEIPGLRDLAANLTKLVEFRLAQVYADHGLLRTILLNYPDYGYPIELYIKTRDQNRRLDSVTQKDKEESFYYESNTCKLPDSKDKYSDNDAQVAWNGTSKYVTFNSDLYYINKLLSIMTFMLGNKSNITDAVINLPYPERTPSAEQTGIFTSYTEVLNRSVAAQTLASCPDINGATFTGIIPVAKEVYSNAQPFDFYDCLIGWDNRNVRLDNNEWQRELCVSSDGKYNDGVYLNCDNFCPAPPKQNQPTTGNVTGKVYPVDNNATCPKPAAYCIQGPDNSQPYGTGNYPASHSATTAVDLTGGSDNVAIAPVAGEVIWAADGFAHSRCASKKAAGGAVIFKPDNGDYLLYMYHVNVGTNPNILKKYQAGEQIARLSNFGDADMESGSCFGGPHIHAELVSGVSGNTPQFLRGAEAGETLKLILAKYGCSMNETATRPACGVNQALVNTGGTTATNTNQSTGTATFASATANNNSIPDYCDDDCVSNALPLPGNADPNFTAGAALGGTYSVSSNFGCNVGGRSGCHTGTDFAAAQGTPIKAVDAGTVAVSSFQGNGYGNYVIITHSNGYQTLYGHMVSTPSVRAGQTVTAGQEIGRVGSTGRSTGPHLHFEIRIPCDSRSETPSSQAQMDKCYLDPLNYVQRGTASAFSSVAQAYCAVPNNDIGKTKTDFKSIFDLMEAVAQSVGKSPALVPDTLKAMLAATISSEARTAFKESVGETIKNGTARMTGDPYQQFTMGTVAKGPLQFMDATFAAYGTPGGRYYDTTLKCVQDIGMNVTYGTQLNSEVIGHAMCAAAAKLQKGAESDMSRGITDITKIIDNQFTYYYGAYDQANNNQRNYRTIVFQRFWSDFVSGDRGYKDYQDYLITLGLL